MSVRTALRLLRAAAFAAVCVALTAVGHAAEGGHAVGPLALAVGFPAVFAVALAAGARERSGAVIAAGMLGCQVGLHLLFTAVDPGGMATTGMPVTACPDASMSVLHLGLAALAAWWLRRGEVACSRLLRRLEAGTAAALRRALAHLTGVAPPAPDSGGARTTDHEPGGGMTLLRSRCAPRRGPPAPVPA